VPVVARSCDPPEVSRCLARWPGPDKGFGPCVRNLPRPAGAAGARPGTPLHPPTPAGPLPGRPAGNDRGSPSLMRLPGRKRRCRRAGSGRQNCPSDPNACHPSHTCCLSLALFPDVRCKCGAKDRKAMTPTSESLSWDKCPQTNE
jgi:hypothetical protein